MKKIFSIAIACVVACWTFWPPEASPHGTITTTVLFDREIVRILSARCVMCHMDGGLSFPLAAYEQTWLRGRSIRTEILRRHMPPWPAVAGYGQFVNDNSLTMRETQFIVSWVEGLGPRNAGNVFLNVVDPKAAPRPEVRASAHVDHWQLGEPDATRRIPANRVEARQGDVTRRTIIDLGLTSERRVRALEYMPGDRRVVRAAVFTVLETGQWLGSWTPWYGVVKLPPGVTYRLPAGSHIVADIHYRGASEPIVDSGSLGLFFAGQGSSRLASDLVLEAKQLTPPRRGAHKLRAAARLESDTYVWALEPDLQPGVTSVEVAARTPDGRTEILLFAKDPSIEWPTPYILSRPLLLRRGSELSVVAHVGSAANPRPSPLRLTVSRY